MLLCLHSGFNILFLFPVDFAILKLKAILSNVMKVHLKNACMFKMLCIFDVKLNEVLYGQTKK